MKKIIFAIFIIIVLFLWNCAETRETKKLKNTNLKTQFSKIILKSRNFKNNGFIPSKYTCDGVNVSPSIYWKNIPENTKSFVLIMDDPDAPFKTWVHWVIYDIPSFITELKENLLTKRFLKNGIKQGINDFKKYGYGGPCPPSGVHRYFFKIYALDINTLNLNPDKATKEVILEKIKGHILGYGELIGKYSRRKK